MTNIVMKSRRLPSPDPRSGMGKQAGKGTGASIFAGYV